MPYSYLKMIVILRNLHGGPEVSHEIAQGLSVRAVIHSFASKAPFMSASRS